VGSQVLRQPAPDGTLEVERFMDDLTAGDLVEGIPVVADGSGAGCQELGLAAAGVAPQMSQRRLGPSAALGARAVDVPRQILVIYMSAHPNEWLASEGRLAEDANLLEKPFSAELLLARVREMLEPSYNTPDAAF